MDCRNEEYDDKYRLYGEKENLDNSKWMGWFDETGKRNKYGNLRRELIPMIEVPAMILHDAKDC